MQTFTGIQYVKIDIANQMGLDKLLWDERIDWVDANMGHLHALVDKADKPILYAKALRALHDAQAGNPTGFIMGLDGTASGLQMYATLHGCHKTGINVNLVNSGKRMDIYQKTADEMNTLPDINVTKKIIKKPLMTTFYGSKRQPKSVFGEDTPELQAFYEILIRELPGAYGLLEDIQSCWNPNAYVHSWTLPDGHRVHAKVMVTNDKKVEVDELEHATFTYRTEINEPSWFGLSLAANVIHSVDGYVAREMVKRTHALGFQMATIHDCFYASPNHMNEVRRTYTEILAEIADSNLMRDILRELTGNPMQAFYKLTSNLSTYIRKSEYALS